MARPAKPPAPCGPAIGAMLRRFPDMELAVPAETLSWRAGLLVHGVISLPVQLGRPAGA